MSRFLIFQLVSFMAFSAPAWCDPVYKWIDDEGIVHYGQQPPVADDTIEAVELDMVPADPEQNQSAQQELQRVVDLAQQLAADRQAREQQAREDRLRALKAAYYEGLIEKQAAPPPPVAEQPDQIIWGAPYYGYYPRHRYQDYVRRRHHPRAGLHISIGRPHKDYHHRQRHKPRHKDADHRRSTSSTPQQSSPPFAPRPQGLSAAPMRE